MLAVAARVAAEAALLAAAAAFTDWADAICGMKVKVPMAAARYRGWVFIG
jgi:hypothetical protein